MQTAQDAAAPSADSSATGPPLSAATTFWFAAIGFLRQQALSVQIESQEDQKQHRDADTSDIRLDADRDPEQVAEKKSRQMAER
jgi:hypothetical protein